MSADDFDPAIERLFARSAPMADAEAFAGLVEQRLARGGRLRAFALGAAGVVGGMVAVREAFSMQSGGLPEIPRLGGGLEAASVGASSAVTARLEQLGLGLSDLAVSGSMQMFWIVAAAMVAVALAGALRLAQDI